MRTNQPDLSLCMIVRDNASTLPQALASAAPWVGEIVVVDTGSRDNTKEIAAEFGARIFDFPWIDHFSAARNVSLQHATGRWLFWMDSDDTIDAVNGRKLQQLAERIHDPRILGFVMQVHCPGGPSGDSNELTVVDHVKMFRNHPYLRFEFRIHEQIIPAIRRLGGEVAWSDIFVVHSGADLSVEGQQRKLERDFRTLNLELKERGEHSFVLFNFGMTYSFMGDHEQAVQFLQRSLRVSHPSESQVRKAFALLVISLFYLQRFHEASDVCRQGLTLFPHDAELLFRHGLLCHHRGLLEEAERAYLSIFDIREDRQFSSVDRGITGFKTRHNLAQVYRDMNRLDLAEVQWRHAVDAAPSFKPSRKYLIDYLRQQGRLFTAEVEEALASVENP
jgi:glycosyltransferase involved in cell wall biosynthesis